MKFKDYIKRKKLRTIFNTKLSKSYFTGTDGVSTTKFKEILDDEITIIKRKINNLTYKISPYTEKLILKGRDKNPRMISIPTNRDKLTFEAVNSFLQDTYKGKLFDKSVYTHIKKIKEDLKLNQYDTFIKLDVISFFPNIDHNILLNKLEKKITDKSILSLLYKSFIQKTNSTGRSKTIQKEFITKGIPQGLSFSNILSSIYMQKIDKKYSKNTNISYHRFVDDILILCKKEDAKKLQKSIVNDINNLKLEVHPFEVNSDKSTIGLINKDTFQFLGYEFYQDIISVRQSTIDKLRDRIIKVIASKDLSKKEKLKKLNLKITGCIYEDKQYGWLYFFRLMNDMKLLYSLDNFVQKILNQYKVTYKDNELKKFSKAYYEMKNHKNKYIPNYLKLIDIKWDDIKEIKDDIEFY